MLITTTAYQPGNAARDTLPVTPSEVWHFSTGAMPGLSLLDAKKGQLSELNGAGDALIYINGSGQLRY